MAQRKNFNFGAANKILSKTETITSEQKEESTGENRESASLLEKIEKAEMASGVVPKAFNFKFVPRAKLVFHKKNDYPMEAIQQIADSILEFGLIHNLEVVYDEENDKYIIESGEQRTRAIDYLIEKFRNPEEIGTDGYQKYLQNVQQFFVEGYPCNVKTTIKHEEELSGEERELESLLSEIRLTLANEIGRGNDDDRKRTKVVRLNELITRRNELLGEEGKVNVNNEIADTLGITTRQVIKYKSISKLIPELQKMFDENHISLKDGENFSKLDEEEQRQILALIENGSDKQEINSLFEKMKTMKREIDDKKKEIDTLKEETVRAQKEVEREKRNAADLEEKIRLQIEKEMEQKNIAELDKLREELKQTQLKLKVSQNKQDVLENRHKQKVEELEKKLHDKKEQDLHSRDIDFLRVSLQMEEKVKTVRMAVEQLKKAYTEYEGIYVTETERKEKSPEEYETEIKTILKWK